MATDKTSDAEMEVTIKAESDEVQTRAGKEDCEDPVDAKESTGEMKEVADSHTCTARVEEGDTDKSKSPAANKPEPTLTPTPPLAAERQEVKSPPTESQEVKSPPTESQEVKPSTESQPPEAEGPKLLDLAFAMDCTGSMGSYISQAQQNIRQIVEDIVSKEQADVRLALVEYRDHPPQDSSFVTNVHDFTSSVREMKSWLDGCSASGGGDGPEAVADALHQVLKLNWRQEATKICVFISDAPPHGLGMDSGDGFPKGCPDGLDPMEIAGKLAEKSVTLYLVGCEPSINRYREFFMALAHVTGGQYVPLGKAQLLTAVITGGAQEELSLERLREEINQEVEQELQGAEDRAYSHRGLSKVIHSKMASKGYQTKSLHLNASRMPQISSTAENLSYCTNLADIRKKMPTAETYNHWGEELSERWGKSTRGGGGARGGRSKKSRGSMKAVSKSAAPAEAADTKSWGSKLTGALYNMFGSTKEADDGGSAEVSTASSVPRGSSSDVYDVVEEDIGEEQVYRMVQKSLMTKNLRSKTRPEEED